MDFYRYILLLINVYCLQKNEIKKNEVAKKCNVISIEWLAGRPRDNKKNTFSKTNLLKSHFQSI